MPDVSLTTVWRAHSGARRLLILGAGLGTLGLPASKAREMAAAAGFTRFRKLDIEHSVNAFYEVRP